MGNFVMPSLGADMEAGTLDRWLVKPGAHVERGDVIAVVETQKGAIDVEVFETGTVSRFLVKPGTEVPVGTPLAYIDTGEGEPTAVGVRTSGRKVSPAARGRAQELGVDIDTVPIPPAGVIGIAEVESAARGKGKPKKRAKSGKGDANAEMRSAIAAAMSRSKREIPHYYLSLDIDVGPARDWLAAYNAERPVTERLLFGVMPVKAVALALREFVQLNGFMEKGRFMAAKDINVGVAIALRGGGLVAPAIHAADRLALPQLMEAFSDLINRVRSGHMRASEMSDPTVTVTSLGEQGVDGVFPIIYPPQVAIVGFGSVCTRPWVVDGQISARPIIRASLAGDHRVSDGHLGACFLDRVSHLLATPEAL